MATLQIFWLIVFTLSTIGFSWLYAFNENDDHLIAACISMILTFVIGWDNGVSAVFYYWCAVLPDHDTIYNQITALVLTLILAITAVILTLFSPFFFMDSDGKIARSNFLKLFSKK
ncbi:hypothetical protein [Vibrio penaeicida]|uniref:TMhelix containing protein n=1 Tax=Vibrio penaeicida TaxID=104609 RepID=A0AAV5NK44_9VIBR|nr:hypothetical protein [Vibrio penaeicida]RTZ23037.1 hypothetical protein EKN09_11175 [Vibrio penaeicida]GLQ71032.1 hypothetical protein GCM10007932_03920 [Vibrio penaeicida]